MDYHLMNFNHSFDNINASWQHLDQDLNRALKLLTDHERFLTEVKRSSGDGLSGVRNEYKSLEV